jgi:hypothetical protein
LTGLDAGLGQRQPEDVDGRNVGTYQRDRPVGGEVKAYLLQTSKNAIGFAAASVPVEGARDLRE